MANSNHINEPSHNEPSYIRIAYDEEVRRSEYFVAYDEMKIEVMDEKLKALDPIVIAFVVRQTLVSVLPPFVLPKEKE